MKALGVKPNLVCYNTLLDAMMKALGVKPNLVCYNTLLDAMGRTKRTWQVKSIYQQLLSSGLTPGWATYASLIRAYGKARYGDDAMIVYKEMTAKGMNLNNVLYNTLLSMCADIGFVDEAVELLDDMKSCTDCKPDSWTYSSMLTIFSCCVKVVEAEAVLKEMVESGFQPNIYVLISLIQCYGKADRTDDVVTTFDRIIELGITPDKRTCGCLLNVMTQTPREELGKLTRCVQIANPKLGSLIEADAMDIVGYCQCCIWYCTYDLKRVC
ncbi:putative tetratricopeptide-like helical domain superfamily [Helianthus annuus]|uniref:Tetratricopeptide-like helical domain superfamily n=3 Tax=Helianthus annuus TaxID=4232 RepID=A0A9K3EI79_HELAN|nr:putative tetratricopeptide-like helical domain superfamily [Helianthus annuus]KAJ0848602.1 putative tetratricopeptide-like helical domain superfamily [Helianthus annuus]